MPIINITERDLLRGKIVEPSWYRVRIDSVEERTSSKGDSQNYIMEGTILFNADTGDTTYANVPTPPGWNFNEKAIGFTVGFISACGGQIGPKGGRFELADSIGKEIDIFVENDVYEGRTVNKIKHKYRVPNMDVTAKA